MCVRTAAAYFDTLFYCYEWEEERWLLGDTFSCVFSVCCGDNDSQSCWFSEPGWTLFLATQRVAVVVFHQMGLIKLDSSFLPKWKAKLIKEGLI